jgi:carbonic anhydrase
MTMRKIFPLLISLITFFGCSDTSKMSEFQKSAEVDSVEKDKSQSARPADWGYQIDDGPSNWSGLSSKYMLCGEGKHQSPIDIINLGQGKGASFHVNYQTTEVRISHNANMDDVIDNGHTIQLDIDDGSFFNLKGEKYHLKQFHFHTPSEHTINGKHYPMEVHFVHQAEDGRLAVIAVFVEEGDKANENIQVVVENLPKVKGEKIHLQTLKIPLKIVIPETQEVYHYSGSLTTPPCSEDVEWLVFKTPISTLKKHIKTINEKINKNNRPTQNLNDREISRVIDQIQE